LVVKSQWAHCPWNLKSPEAAPVLPVAMVAQQPKQAKLEEGVPCLVWKTSQLTGA
jgi:hypothetical protein